MSKISDVSDDSNFLESNCKEFAFYYRKQSFDAYSDVSTNRLSC